MDIEMSEAASNFNFYGFRQDEFSCLPAYAQAEVVEYCQAIANMMNYARGLEVIHVCADGFKITRAMVEQEIRETRAPLARFANRVTFPPMVIGLNASSNMFA